MPHITMLLRPSGNLLSLVPARSATQFLARISIHSKDCSFTSSSHLSRIPWPGSGSSGMPPWEQSSGLFCSEGGLEYQHLAFTRLSSFGVGLVGWTKLTIPQLCHCSQRNFSHILTTIQKAARKPITFE